MQWRDTSKQRKAGQGKSNAWEDQASTSKAKAAATRAIALADVVRVRLESRHAVWLSNGNCNDLNNTIT